MAKTRDEQIETLKRDGTPFALVDTVEVPFPGPAGRRFTFFRDLTGKDSQTAHGWSPGGRLETQTKLLVELVRVEITPWSGDAEWARRMLAFAGKVEISVNTTRRLALLTGATLQFGGSLLLPAGEVLTDMDQISAHLQLGGTEIFTAPVEHGFAEKLQTETSRIDWPVWAEKLAGRLGIDLPLIRRSRSSWEKVSRPLSGSVLVQLRVEGRALRAVGT